MNNFGKAIITFIIGMILSCIVGVTFNDGGLATATAVCYLGAIMVWLFYETENKHRDVMR